MTEQFRFHKAFTPVFFLGWGGEVNAEYWLMLVSASNRQSQFNPNQHVAVTQASVHYNTTGKQNSTYCYAYNSGKQHV